MENRFDPLAKRRTDGASWRQALRRLGRRLLPAGAAQPLDFDDLAREVARGLSRREVLRRLAIGLAGAMLASLSVGPARAAEGALRCSEDDPCSEEAFAEYGDKFAECELEENPWAALACMGIATLEYEAAVTECRENQCGENVCSNGVCCPLEIPENPFGGVPGLAVGCVSSSGDRAACCSQLRGETCCDGTCCPAGQSCSNRKCCPTGQHNSEGLCCPEDQHNSDGICCPTDQTNCGGRCVDLEHDAANCGACGKACAGGRVCKLGFCDCPTGQVLCNEQCCGNVCCDQTCCAPGEGCCNGECCDGVCCDGRCCNADETCVDAQCRKQCPEGQSRCGDACVNLQTDPGNCGACGRVCPAGQSCFGGQCSGGCPDGQTVCPGSNACVNLLTDSHNCGACGNSCAGKCGQVGPHQCICCSGKCTDIFFDPFNCGACGNTCPSGQTCDYLDRCVDCLSVNPAPLRCNAGGAPGYCCADQCCSEGQRCCLGADRPGVRTTNRGACCSSSANCGYETATLPAPIPACCPPGTSWNPQRLRCV
jgi:hypothetical protein